MSTDEIEIPKVGSREYKVLDFRSQLEIVSLKIFDPEEYTKKVGEELATRPSDELTDLDFLSYPDNSKHGPAPELPLSFVKHYWAGYSCKFSEKWYLYNKGSKGVTPLDEYDIDCKWMVNLWAFNFSLLSLEPALNRIFHWVAEIFNRNLYNSDTLLDACRVYAFISMTPESRLPMRRNRKGKLELDPRQVLLGALNKYSSCMTFEDLNNEFPMAEPCEELDYVEWGDYCLLPQPKVLNHNFVYPVLPQKLYSTSKFAIKRWDFVDPPSECNYDI